jgi:hypothetical protein
MPPLAAKAIERRLWRLKAAASDQLNAIPAQGVQVLVLLLGHHFGDAVAQALQRFAAADFIVEILKTQAAGFDEAVRDRPVPQGMVAGVDHLELVQNEPHCWRRWRAR